MRAIVEASKCRGTACCAQLGLGPIGRPDLNQMRLASHWAQHAVPLHLIREINMTPEQHKRLSKKLSSLLRHRPRDLALDDAGFAPLHDVLKLLHADETRVREVVRDSDKQRFEIIEIETGAKIRARYGHSVVPVVDYQPITPPEILYHGTSRGAIANIQCEGLRSMNRQYVHLSIEREIALSVGRRHDSNPTILIVRAGEAHQNGVEFYNPEARLFLVKALDARWIDFP